MILAKRSIPKTSSKFEVDDEATTAYMQYRKLVTGIVWTQTTISGKGTKIGNILSVVVTFPGSQPQLMDKIK